MVNLKNKNKSPKAHSNGPCKRIECQAHRNSSFERFKSPKECSHGPFERMYSPIACSNGPLKGLKVQ